MNDPIHCASSKTRPEGVLEVPRLLVIEDDPVQRALIVRAAETTGYRTVAVQSCREAIEQLKTNRFSCLTLDLTLEDGDGFDVMWQMANAGYRVPVMVVSGTDARSRSTCRARMKELGIEVTQSFAKPVDLAVLRIALANLRCAAAKLPNLHGMGEVRIPEYAASAHEA
jgi:two-component system chemotaxis response regulator CheY